MFGLISEIQIVNINVFIQWQLIQQNIKNKQNYIFWYLSALCIQQFIAHKFSPIFHFYIVNSRHLPLIFTIKDSHNKQMLLSKEYIIKMPKKYRKILCIYAAYNQTFFFLGQKQLRQDFVAHVDLRGRILFQFTFDRPVQSCGMLSDRQAIVLETRSNSITLFDLQTYKFQRYAHQFMYEQADQSNILTFSDRKLLCLQEKSRYGHHRYKLSYYYYPFTKNSINRPCSVYQAKDQEWTIEYQTMKANNSSMVVWWKPLKDNAIHFFSFHLRDNPKGTLNQYTISVQSIFTGLGFCNFTQKMQVGTTHIWQMKKSVYLIIALVSVGSIEKKCPFTRYLVYDSDNQSLRQAKFSFGMRQDYVISCYNLGTASIFLTYEQSQGHINSSPMYYVDHESEQVAADPSWYCNNNTSHGFPGYQTGLVCQSFHELEQVEKFDMTIRKLMTPKEMYVFVMMQAYPTLEQDLVVDVIKALYHCRDLS